MVSNLTFILKLSLNHKIIEKWRDKYAKLAEAIAAAVQAGQDKDWGKMGTSIVGIVENGISVLGKIFGF